MKARLCSLIAFQRNGSRLLQIRSIQTTTFNYIPPIVLLLPHLGSASTTAGMAVMQSGTQRGLVFHSLPPSSALALLICFAASVSKTHQKSLQENDYLTFSIIGTDWLVLVCFWVVSIACYS